MKIEILSCKKEKDKYLIEVKENPFYVDGKGGQLGDRGKINNINVLEVLEENKLYIAMPLEIGIYDYEIDRERQKDIAVQHTAQHIFSATAKTYYDYNTVGFRMAEEYSTVDFDSNEITKETIENIEKKVNDVISKSIEVETFILSNKEAREIENLRKPVSTKIIDDVRFVKIPEVDLGACAGFHVENTSKIKIFKIIHHEHVKGKYTRFYFIAGDRAYKDYSYKTMLTNELKQIFSCKDYEILEMLDKSLKSKMDTEKELKIISNEYATLLKEKLIQNSADVANFKIIIYSGNEEVCNTLHKVIQEENIILITNTDKNYTVTSKTINCKDFVEFLKENSDIVGGGGKMRGNFRSSTIGKNLFELTKKYLSCK